MIRHLQRALRDLADNYFLHLITVVMVTTAVVIAGGFALFGYNAARLAEDWTANLRLTAYLVPDLPSLAHQELQKRLVALDDVGAVRFISKTEALAELKGQLAQQSELLASLDGNPLPDAFEIRITPSAQADSRIAALAHEIQELPEVEEVSYGGEDMRRMLGVIHLIRFCGTVLTVLFGMAAIFIVANTMRLILYARQKELSIMSLVGATEAFIRTPFYIQAVLQGVAGALLGLGLLRLMLAYIVATLAEEQPVMPMLHQITFFPLGTQGVVVLLSVGVGWLGCYLALKEFLKI